jgi:antibiotic biosynthesis monooxygenase (ABM) superfamily enzyme
LVVLAIMKWDIHPDKIEAYQKWTGSAIKRCLAVPGVIEYRGYRGLAGTPQVMQTFEFADLAAYAVWRSNVEVQKAMDEAYTLALNVTTELWGPSPVVPKPIRPGK